MREKRDKNKEGKTLFNIVYFDSDSPFEGRNVHVKSLNGVDVERLYLIELSSPRGLQIYKVIFSWLIENRDFTFKSEERRRTISKK